MNPDPGFVDLRLNRQDSQTDEGFWPSFTDIMTVIVMIFLLAMVILLMRNMELVERLRATMQAERSAAELARTTGAEKDTLAGQLNLAQREITLLRQRIGRMEEHAEQQEAAVSSQRHQIAELNRKRDQLKHESGQRLALSESLQRDLDASRTALANLQAEHNQLRDRHRSVQSELDVTRKSQASTNEELAQTRKTLNDLQNQQALLKTRFDHEQAALAMLHEQFQAQGEELRARQTSLSQIRQEKADSETRFRQSQRSLDKLKQDYALLKSRMADMLAKLTDTDQRLSQRQAEQTRTLAELDRERTRIRELEAVQTAHQALQQQQAQSQKEAEELRTKLQIQEQALAQALARLSEANISLSELQDNYGNLQLKYHELVKPARSAEGRYVVEVRYEKIAGRPQIRFRERRDGEFRVTTTEQLDKILIGLRNRHKQGLYIRVIIPEDSGLSYNEAWKFTTEVHRKYDYYFQRQ